MAKHSGDAKKKIGDNLNNTDWLVSRFSMSPSSMWFIFSGAIDSEEHSAQIMREMEAAKKILHNDDDQVEGIKLWNYCIMNQKKKKS